MSFRFRRRLRRTSDGAVEVRLPARDRDQLRSLANDLHTLLDDPTDPALRRLFPPAYAEDAARDAAYQMTMGDELRQAHMAAAEVLRSSADVEQLAPDEATSWLQAINATRLVLGTRLGIDDDAEPIVVRPDDPNLSAWVAYEFLSGLLFELVEVMTA